MRGRKQRTCHSYLYIDAYYILTNTDIVTIKYA